jgi:ubiquinone biosynthesis protein Coq4
MASAKTVIERDYLAFAKACAVWASNPVSERGAAHIFQMVYAAGGPNVRDICDAMARHPDGAKLLRERPDLGAALMDNVRLSHMPSNSIGYAYYEFMMRSDVLPGYLLGGLAYRYGAFDRLNWPSDMKWLVERVGNTHDLTHVISGYGADLAGEVLNTNFSLGAVNMPLFHAFSRAFGIGSALVLRPKCGWDHWVMRMNEAYERGRAIAQNIPFYCIPYEEYLPLTVEEARKRLGVPPLADGSYTLDSGHWLSNRMSTFIATGFGALDIAMVQAQHARKLVEAGLTPRELMSANEDTRHRVERLRAQGASVELLIAEFRRGTDK